MVQRKDIIGMKVIIRNGLITFKKQTMYISKGGFKIWSSKAR